jgi:phenylacetic acid degradation operon negative regulatory protein
MRTTSFNTVVRNLTEGQSPRVWSLLISVFGDLAQKEGSRISGALLRQLTEAIGIKPEAMRVAIHRLRKEGWIDSQRNGRTSVYFLTAWGRAQSAQATPRIYATGQAADHAWLVMFNPTEPAPKNDLIGAWVSSNVLITSIEPESKQTFVSSLSAQTTVPDWISSKVCEEPTLRMSQDFAKALEQVTRHFTPAPALPLLEVAALRVLLVHGWRRIILKAPLLPDYIFPKKWSGPQCRLKVASLLAQYPTPALDELETAVTSAATAMMVK